MNDLELQAHKNTIDKMSRLEMAGKIRFGEPGHVYFTNDILNKYFMDRFYSLGGWSPEISKALGWR
jgi:hypothetical protein